MIQLLLNTTTPRFQLLPILRITSSSYAFMRCRLYSNQKSHIINLYIKFRILQQLDEDLDTDAKVFPINNFFHSMFSSIYLYMSNKLITNNSDMYPYRAYHENVFSYGFDVKDSKLKAPEFWHEDEP